MQETQVSLGPLQHLELQLQGLCRITLLISRNSRVEPALHFGRNRRLLLRDSSRIGGASSRRDL